MSVKDLMLTALFAALTAMLSQVSFYLPFTPVPFNLATFSVFMAGGLLGAARGGMSQLVYVLLGAAGAPVFSRFSGGLGYLTGPTGGFIAGYAAAAFVIGLIIAKLPKKMLFYAAAMMVGAVCYFTMGTLWFMFVTKNTLAAALAMCVFPYIPGDLLKIALAAILVRRLLIPKFTR